MCSTVEGLAAVWPTARFSSPAAEFYANALTLRFGPFEVETIESSAYTCIRDEALVSQFPRPAIAIEIVLEGRVRRQQQGLDYEQTAGEVAVTLLNEPFGFTWAGGGRSVRTVTALTLLPSEFRVSGAVRSGLLPDSLLVAAYIEFMRSLVDTAQPSAAENRPLETAALGLHRAVLVEALHPRSAPSTRLRTRIEEHIDAHLPDPELSPTTIAAELGMSLRSIHGAFNTADLTVAAEIRRRRVLAAAALLLESDYGRQLSSVMREVGFTNIDRMRSSFLTVLGTTPSGYRNRRTRC